MSKKNKRNMRQVWQSMFPPQAKRFLDIGCGQGKMTQYLVDDGKEVVGIEVDAKDAAIAQKYLSKVIIGSAENIQLSYPSEYFDCILYGGVIGAFYNPLETLKLHGNYLKDGGHVLAHVPNLRYYKTITMLTFKGTWDYMPHGILYHYYIRHFTWTTIKELFEALGYKIVAVEKNMRANGFLKFLNIILFGLLEEFLVYEYYIKAVKDAGASKTVQRKKETF